jgi:NAD(P)-dependent dehydrogenase (short-subunit alcohol dehydrogenase family)
VALVTGAARGVGEEITTRLLGAGVQVLAVDRDRATLEELAGRLGGAAALHPVVADVRFRPELEAAVTAALDVFGRIDILVNNAGRWTVAPFVASDPAAWDDDLAINLVGPLHLTQLVLPHMISAGWGRVVSVVSDSGRVGEPNVTVYSAAKAGLAGFSRSLAKEVGRHGITVNCVSLSTTLSPGGRATFDEAQFEKMVRRYPMGRLGLPADAAAAVLFFAGDEAGWVTGQVLSVNGGYAML